jgi:hypothetical protein
MARRTICAAALAALAALPLAPPALAHEGSPDYESLVRSIAPRIPGFAVEVLNGDDRLEARNTGAATVTIEGYDDEPYLRLRPNGIVEANLRSPAHYLNQDRFSGAKVPASADAGAAPRWTVVARTGRYEFHDHRMHWMARNVPQQVTDRSKRTKVFDWSVPLRVRGSSGAISGELFWRGSGPGAPLGAYVALGAVMLLGAGSVVLVRRRRAAAAAADHGHRPPRRKREAW